MLNPVEPKKIPYRDIKEELEGRTHEVLAILGINPIAMVTQIPCPLESHHLGHPTFMVNAKKNRYYCAQCTPKGGSLVDLVIGLGKAKNFSEAAKYLRFNVLRNLCISEYEKRFENTEDFRDD